MDVFSVSDVDLNVRHDTPLTLRLLMLILTVQGQLFRTNHSLLCALEVGHPALTAVVEASALQGMSCKLTVDGGGGCAITLLPLEGSVGSHIQQL